MFEIKGKYNSAKVYADIIEQEAYSQVQNMLNQKFSEGSNIAIMPDVHAGKGCVIGFTQTIVDKVVPNLVGVDIGCGMLVAKLKKGIGINFENLDRVIREKIPSGCNHRTTKHPFARNIDLSLLHTPIKEKLLLSIGTLGGGNHFIEVDKDNEGCLYIVIHSGSRHLGIEVANYHQKKAIEYHKNHKSERDAIIKSLKAEGKRSEIGKALAEFDKKNSKIPDELAYLEGALMDDYLNDMKITQNYADWNRAAMMQVILFEMGIKESDVSLKFCTVHNYISLDDMILRKGAISLQDGEMAIIPMNMRDGSLIVRGKGNKEWNYSGPHGAGRIMSRSKAKENLKMEDFEESMKGIYSTSVLQSTIDESPMAYKPMQSILDNINGNAEVISEIKPVYNFKASE